MPLNQPPTGTPATTARILFDVCFNCRDNVGRTRHWYCSEVWWEADGDDVINMDGRGQCIMCDCEEC